MATQPKFTTEDVLNSEFPGLERIAMENFAIPFVELSPGFKHAVKRLAEKEAAGDMLAALKALVPWLQHHLASNVITRSTGKGGHDGDGNSWAAAAIPTWDVRQRIDEMVAAIQKAEGRL